MKKTYTLDPPRKVGSTGKSVAKAGAVGMGGLLVLLGGLVMLGTRILDKMKKKEE